MVVLKVPSLQQVMKNLHDSVDMVRRDLVKTALNPPRISYRVLHRATQDRVCLGVALDQIEAGIRRVEKRPEHLKNLLDILRLIDGHFSTLVPDFPPIEVECRHYQIAPDIIIPFQPPLCYGIGGQLYLPYPNYWRNNPLRGKRLSVFITIVDEIREQEPDLEKARVHILNYGIPQGETERRLVVLDENDIPRVSREELSAALQIFANGYRAARDELVGVKMEKDKGKDERRSDPNQSNLFGETD
jgi:hypothetical protein